MYTHLDHIQYNSTTFKELYNMYEENFLIKFFSFYGTAKLCKRKKSATLVFSIL
jgi:hypothetical protein